MALDTERRLIIRYTRWLYFDLREQALLKTRSQLRDFKGLLPLGLSPQESYRVLPNTC